MSLEMQYDAALPSSGPFKYTFLDIENGDEVGDNQKTRSDTAEYL